MFMVLLTLALVAITTLGQSQNMFMQECVKMLQHGEIDSLQILLDEWRKAKPDDPELYVCYFNYFINIARTEMMVISKEKPSSGPYLEIMDSAGQPAGYITTEIVYDDSLLQKAIQYIDTGISLNPDRLDMRFGKIHVLGESNRWHEFTEEILKVLDRSAENGNQWLWSNNQPLDDAKTVMLESIQTYVFQLMTSQADSSLIFVRQISRKVLEYYPNHVPSMSNIAATYLLEGDKEKLPEAINLLHRAEKISPEDCVVVNNLAYAYRQLGDRKQAAKYYKKVLRYCDDDETRENAMEQLKLLKEE